MPLEIRIALLMLLAALLHASWHAMVKSSGDRVIGLAGMNVVSAGLALLALPFVAPPRPEIWPLLAISLALHSGYKFSLARAYDHGDLGQAYPLARGMAPLFSTVLAIAVLDEIPGTAQFASMALVCLGVMAIALERGIEIRWPLLIAAAGAGLTVAGYTVVDGRAARLNGDWLAFTVYLMVLDGGCFVALAFLLRRRLLWSTLVETRQRVLVSGLLGTASFSVFLWALSLGKVSMVSALRETSILFSALIGLLALGEKATPIRMLGIAAILIGVMGFVIYR